jgi:outer membrane protein TolC
MTIMILILRLIYKPHAFIRRFLASMGFNRALFIAIIPALFLSPLLGCARPLPPEKSLSEITSFDEKAKERYLADEEWWLKRGDPTLNALLDHALQNNLSLARAKLTVQKADVQASVSEAGLFPTLSGSLSGQSRLDFERGESSKSQSGNLGLSYSADLWGINRGEVSAARLESLAAERDYNSLRISLIGRVTDAYYNLAYLNDALSQNQRNLNILLTLEEKVKLKYESGAAPPVEPIQAALSVLNARDAILNSHDEIFRAKANLKNILNLRPADDLKLDNISLNNAVPLPPDLNIPYSALANNPDLKAAELRLYKAFKNAEAISKSYLPSVSLSSGVSVSSDNLGTFLESPQGSLGLSISLPFLDFSRVRGNIKISELEYETVKLNFEETLTSAFNEIDALYETYRTKLMLLKSLKLKQDYSARVSEYYRERYEAGATELSDWLNAVNSANSISLSVLSGTYQLIAAENLIYDVLAGRYQDTENP